MSHRPRIDPSQYARDKAEKIERARLKREAIKRARAAQMGETSEEGKDGGGEEGKSDHHSSPVPPPPSTPPPQHIIEKHKGNTPTNKSRSLGGSSQGHFGGGGGHSRSDIAPLTQFLRGPLHPEGLEFDPASFEKRKDVSRIQKGSSEDSDRPSTCIAVNPTQSECVVGSADHASYTFSTRNASPLRRLYSRTAGHSDWVSACTYLCDNRILTGGMDGKVCLWRRGGSDCTDLFGEQGSVSVLKSLSDDTPLAASAGYDGSIIVWNCQSVSVIPTKITNKRKQLPPLTAFNHNSSLLALSGSNNGLVSLWDLNSGVCTRAAAGKHLSQIQHCLPDTFDPSTFYTAAVDGKVGLWDTRGPLGSATGNEIGATLSTTPFTDNVRAGAAPISGLCDVDDYTLLVSGGTEVALLDKRKNLAVASTLRGHNSPIASLCVGGGGRVSFSGAVDGMVVAHDLRRMEPIYGMGANKKSSAFLATTEDRLIVTGDDGHALVYDFD
ncbi:hypothetical protein TrST_g2943 [Triparma strigata]|uniref:Uncharacterized protein n=1 Tax=Triparma strigata TaxID=1606541 RepID=A0A9W7B2W5_9STRA|nr:hypothetical protein TrST_g2943 [Triparma strigata]